MNPYDADGILAGLNEALDYVRHRNSIVAMTDSEFREWTKGKHRSTYTRERQWRTDDRHERKMALKHNRDWTAEDWATFDSMPSVFDHLDDDEPDTLPGEGWGDYLHILYASPLFEREWQNLIGQGWTTITVEAWIDGDHGNICHVCGAMGAGWRCWPRAGGYEIITHKPDWIMANLDPTLKAYLG